MTSSKETCGWRPCPSDDTPPASRLWPRILVTWTKRHIAWGRKRSAPPLPATKPRSPYKREPASTSCETASRSSTGHRFQPFRQSRNRGTLVGVLRGFYCLFYSFSCSFVRKTFFVKRVLRAIWQEALPPVLQPIVLALLQNLPVSCFHAAKFPCKHFITRAGELAGIRWDHRTLRGYRIAKRKAV